MPEHPATHYTESSELRVAELRAGGFADSFAWLQLALGLLLNGVAWISAWGDVGPLRHHSFFPLWLGYILVVDGVLQVHSGSSLIRRLGWRFSWFFAMSIPLWWFFEVVNERLGNWSYVLPEDYSWFRYHAEATLAFSTVVPAVLVTAELIRAVVLPGQIRWISIRPGRDGLKLISLAGLAMLGLTFAWPDIFFPLVWIGLFLFIDPIANLVGGTSVSSEVFEGRWDTVFVILMAALICGFFWEFWNYWSMPKWEYDVPQANRFRIFEMPALGYGGYLPFGLEVYAVVCLLDRVTNLRLAEAFRLNRAKPGE